MKDREVWEEHVGIRFQLEHDRSEQYKFGNFDIKDKIV